MEIFGVQVDVSRGFDVMSGSRVLKRFSSYDEAKAYAGLSRRRYVRYWAVKA